MNAYALPQEDALRRIRMYSGLWNGRTRRNVVTEDLPSVSRALLRQCREPVKEVRGLVALQSLRKAGLVRGEKGDTRIKPTSRL